MFIIYDVLLIRRTLLLNKHFSNVKLLMMDVVYYSVVVFHTVLRRAATTRLIVYGLCNVNSAKHLLPPSLNLAVTNRPFTRHLFQLKMNNFIKTLNIYWPQKFSLYEYKKLWRKFHFHLEDPFIQSYLKWRSNLYEFCHRNNWLRKIYKMLT